MNCGILVLCVIILLSLWEISSLKLPRVENFSRSYFSLTVLFTVVNGTETIKHSLDP